MSGSIAYDLAASFYDETRRLPPQTEAAQTRLLEAELRGRGPVVEVGVGTGRVGLPLARAGIPLVGIDLSRPMLDRLVEKLLPGEAARVAVADATALPFADSTLGGAVVCHVLHLLTGWSDAVAEMARVVRKSGVVLVDLGGPEGGPVQRLMERLAEELGDDFQRPGTRQAESVDAAFAEHGAAVRLLEPIRYERTRTPRQVCDLIRANRWQATWRASEARRHEVVDRLEVWAAGELGPLDTPVVFSSTIQWRRYLMGMPAEVDGPR